MKEVQGIKFTYPSGTSFFFPLFGYVKKPGNKHQELPSKIESKK